MQALSPGSTDIVLWAESPEEARLFLAKARSSGSKLKVDRVFVAKRSGKVRHNRYLGGEYYPATNDEAVDTLAEIVTAPQSIIDLVQWCTCDIMISRGDTPLLVIEDTTHIVRMNVYQRFPRLLRAAVLGIPSAVLQGTRGLDFRMRGDRWGLYRYLQAFEALSRAYPEVSTLPFWYDEQAGDVGRAQLELFEFVDAVIAADSRELDRIRSQVLERMRAILNVGIENEIPPDLPSIEHRGKEVRVKIGAKPEKKSWREKGSGQMDPYIGMIAAAKYIYCFNADGEKVKPMVVDFSYLPAGFWFFRDGKEATALYKRLPYEFADVVEFNG